MTHQMEATLVEYIIIILYSYHRSYEEETTLSAQETIHDGAQRQFLVDYS